MNNLEDIIIWGATGQAIVLEEFLKYEYNILALYDKNLTLNSPITNIPLYSNKNNFIDNFKDQKIKFIVAIGGQNGKIRIDIHNWMKSQGFIDIIAIHPKSVIADNAELGEGNQILINATIGSRVKTGKCVIVNSSASVDHECILNDGVHIGPGAKLAGCVEVGENCFIGTGAIILPRIKIGKNSIVGAGAVVTKDIPPHSIAVGNPAKVIKTIDSIQLDGDIF